ncbi:hypothetical protein [Prosthecobacter sp.]|uniref:hypothetical protein n=1 Tax=Prosthecobacter sp. TaxID=1965333 RepID=UPI002AB8960E|nr:hypothetical protein [Prosthecobacter sp.]MDZ4402414.1 hypothetical protein [Prosthecobacter sp.]
MNTNPDALENDLRALQRRELPPEWHREILRITKLPPRTPRWLVAGWSMAWAAILLMYFTTPAEPDMQPSSAHATPAMLWQERAALIEDLLAVN